MPDPESRVAQIYGATQISERHRHRYEVNIAYRDTLEAAGLRFSGMSPDGLLPEIVELPEEVHPWFVGVQFHPELKSRPFEPHPLFTSFIQAAVAQSRLVWVWLSLRAQRSNLGPHRTPPLEIPPPPSPPP